MSFVGYQYMKPNAQLLSVQTGMYWSQAHGFEARAHFLSQPLDQRDPEEGYSSSESFQNLEAN